MPDSLDHQPSDAAETQATSAASPESNLSPKQLERQKRFESLCKLFRESLQRRLTAEELRQHPLGKKLLRLVRATFEQRGLYPKEWRTQFVRQVRTLHSMTGYRDVRTLLFVWLRNIRLFPSQADVFVYSEPKLRRHLSRIDGDENQDTIQRRPDAKLPDAIDRIVITIDNPETLDRDDALSFRMIGTDYEVGIHTPVLTEFVLRDGEWDKWAREVTASVYMPHKTIPMLPLAVSTRLAGLDSGCQRDVLSFYFSRDKEGVVRFQRACREQIKIDYNAAYEEVEGWLAVLSGEDPREKIHGISKIVPRPHVLMADELPASLQTALEIWRADAVQLEKQRVAAGGRAFDRIQIDVLLTQAGMVELRPAPQGSPAHKMVAEWMIAANQAAAEFCYSNRLPCIYRVQETASAKATEEESEAEHMYARPQLAMTRAPHRDLGIEGYTQITSPMRRYGDLMMQRQILSFLETGSGCYTEEELWQAATSLEVMNRRLQRLESRSMFHYKCVYLAQHLGESFAADISHSPPPARNVVLTFPDLELRLFVPQSCIKGLGGRQIPPADSPLRVSASCLEMDPDRGTMVFQIKRNPAREGREAKVRGQ